MKKLVTALIAALMLAGCSSSEGASEGVGSVGWLDDKQTSAVTTAASSSRKEEPSSVVKPAVREPLSYASKYYLESNADGRIRDAAGVLLAGMKEHSEKTGISEFELSEKEFADIFGLLLCCEPELCWVEYNYTIGKIPDGGISNAYFKYRMSENEKAEALRKLDAAADEIVSACEGLGDFERVLYFHDYIVTHCDYDKSSENAWSAYGCLVEGKAVCEGYSKALLLVCTMPPSLR